MFQKVHQPVTETDILNPQHSVRDRLVHGTVEFDRVVQLLLPIERLVNNVQVGSVHFADIVDYQVLYYEGYYPPTKLASRFEARILFTDKLFPDPKNVITT